MKLFKKITKILNERKYLNYNKQKRQTKIFVVIFVEFFWKITLENKFL